MMTLPHTEAVYVSMYRFALCFQTFVRHVTVWHQRKIAMMISFGSKWLNAFVECNMQFSSNLAKGEKSLEIHRKQCVAVQMISVPSSEILKWRGHQKNEPMQLLNAFIEVLFSLQLWKATDLNNEFEIKCSSLSSMIQCTCEM